MRVRVGVRIQSESLSVEQISELVGVEPTRATRKGSLVSSRNPDGPTRTVTNWHFEVIEEADDPMTPAFERVQHVLDRLAEVPASDQARDVVLMLHGRDMGAWYEIEPQHIDLMAKAGAGLILDVYNSDE